MPAPNKHFIVRVTIVRWLDISVYAKDADAARASVMKGWEEYQETHVEDGEYKVMSVIHDP